MVPPRKSTPYLKPPLTTRETRPRSIIEPEIARKSFLFPSQSTLIPLNSSIISNYPFRHHGVCDCSKFLNTYGFRTIFSREHPLKQGSRHENGRKHVRNQADHQGHRETLHRTGPEKEQECCRNQGCKVGVHKSYKNTAETRDYCRNRRFAGVQFFANTLKNKNIRVDAHADGENDAGNDRQCQCRY